MDDADLTGRALGEFQVLRRIGAGGMGQVYLAEQRSLKREVALKVLKPELAANTTALLRFQAEAESLARVTHANIVQVYAIGQADGLHYMALEYVRGTNLRDYLIKKGTPELPVALSVMRQVAAALQRAGELGVVHRDVKPENILLTRKGEVKVADFGLSRCFLPDAQPLNLTQSGVTMGTPLYMSPEQVQGHPVDARSDVYSFGVTAYALLAGQPPFRGQTAFEVALQHVQAEPRPLAGLRPDLPPELCALIHRMLAKKPEDRPQTAREVLRELARLREAVAGGATGALWSSALADSVAGAAAPPAPAPPDLGRTAPPAPPPAAPRRRAGKLVVLALACAAAALAGAGLDWWRNQGPAAEAGPAGEPIDRLPLPLSEEDYLLRSVRQAPAPAGPGEATRLLKESTRLGLMYLQTDQLTKAEALFAELTRSERDESFRRLGRIGQALLLSRQNKPELANDAFREVMPARAELPRGGPLAPVEFKPPLDDAELRFAMVQALNRNEANLKRPAQMPPPLVQFRQYLGRRPAKGG